MKQMKRAAGLLLALVLVLSMAACGKKDGDGGDSQSGFQRGTIENGIYTNTFVGIGCQLSDDWTYYTDEQLAELSRRGGREQRGDAEGHGGWQEHL